MIDEKYIKEGHVGIFLLKLSVIEPRIRKKIIKNLTGKLIRGEEKYKFLLIDIEKAPYYLPESFCYRVRYSFVCKICKKNREEELTLVLLEDYYVKNFPTICDKCK